MKILENLTQTNTARTATVETDTARYIVQTVERNTTVTEATASVHVYAQCEQSESGSVLQYAGSVTYKNGSFSTERLSVSEAAQHIAAVAEYIEEVQKGEVA